MVMNICEAVFVLSSTIRANRSHSSLNCAVLEPNVLATDFGRKCRQLYQPRNNSGGQCCDADNLLTGNPEISRVISVVTVLLSLLKVGIISCREFLLIASNTNAVAWRKGMLVEFCGLE
jgi:hypothetical protein